MSAPFFPAVKSYFAGRKSFAFEQLHHYDGLLAAGPVRMFHDIIRDNNRTNPFTG